MLSITAHVIVIVGWVRQGTIAIDVTIVIDNLHGTGVWGALQPVSSLSGAAGNCVDRWSHHHQHHSCHAIILKLSTNGASTGVPEVVVNSSIAFILKNVQLDVAQQGEDQVCWQWQARTAWGGGRCRQKWA
ncbi:hypothetical protein EDB86DRAFT_2991063 [Lactarius hatsudake]|nr:hypothetical protein EDB86DRAFT_2991063 [Lactarius hatsudake]